MEIMLLLCKQVSALEDVAQEQGGLAKEEASKFVRQLELTGRYCVEAWS
jgi:sulfite reductase alpha subunit-like flavoprotein